MTAASTTLPAQTSSVPVARRFVRSALGALGLDAAYEAAEMLVSEVVTNAVLHARTDFTVVVLRDGDTVRVSVMDLSRAVPRQRSYDADSTTGRGLRLVATLSTGWGVERTPAGKTVWFEVPAAGDAGERVAPWDADTDRDTVVAAFEDLGAGAVAGQAPTAWVGRRLLGRPVLGRPVLGEPSGAAA